MRIDWKTNVIGWSSAFLAAVALQAACSSSDSNPNATDGGGGGAGGGSTSSPSSSRASSSRSSSSVVSASSSTGVPFTCDDNPHLACSHPQPVLVGATNTGFVGCDDGKRHRAAVATCPSTLPRAATCDDGGVGTCASDADCVDMPNGLCSDASGVCGCQYGCTTDADCGASMICECGADIGACVPASCASDDDCGAGLLCATYSLTPGGCGAAQGYACQTCPDGCAVDTDCDAPDGCGLDAVTSARVCAYQCGVPGRPFLVDGLAVVAPVVRASGWSMIVAAPAPLSADDARRAAAHWTAAAQAEHASVAAFARFALDLLAVGAPAELLMETQAAMADEIAHARLAFAFASHFAGQPVGPGPLAPSAIEGALAGRTLASIVRDAVLEGCIGEAVAALEARESAAIVADPVVRSALEVIAEDERRHALLAYRFVAWAMARDPSLEGVVREAVESVPEGEDRGEGAPDLGILCGVHRAALRRHVVDELVLRGALEARAA